MSTTWTAVTTGKTIEANWEWEFEKDLFDWGVMPQHEGTVIDIVNQHLVVHTAHEVINIAMDSEFPKDTSIEWQKINPVLTNDEGLGNYIHIWVDPSTGDLFITILRPDLAEYVEMRTGDKPRDEQEQGPWGWTMDEYMSAKNGEEG